MVRRQDFGQIQQRNDVTKEWRRDQDSVSVTHTGLLLQINGGMKARSNMKSNEKSEHDCSMLLKGIKLIQKTKYKQHFSSSIPCCHAPVCVCVREGDHERISKD